MVEETLIGLGIIIFLGVTAEWLSLRLHLPSIVFLLLIGFLAGPVTGILNPDEIFGKLLFPFISISVAIILFEGGMDLRIDELKGIGRVIRNLITVGVVVTWAMVSAAAHFIIGLEISISILIGAILVVTGPTVIGPLLRHIRPVGRVGNVVKWEGIMNDPIGVVLAVLVFESILLGEFQSAGSVIMLGVMKTIFVSAFISIVSTTILVFLIKRYWVPDTLHEVVTLMFVVISFVASNMLQVESGLLTVTLMGIILANQKAVPIKHILEFKENLRVLIISLLFVVLAARLTLEDLQQIDARSILFLVILILIVRPVSVWISTWRSNLTWKEKLFISWMAPRGIVAAAISSIFAFELLHVEQPGAEQIVPTVFMVIIGTVSLYGLTASALARSLKLSEPEPQGLLVVGAHTLARHIAKAVQNFGFNVVMIDTNKFNVEKAKEDGIRAHHGNILSETVPDEINLEGIGRFLALTSNDEANSLAALRYREIFGMANVYQLFPEKEEKAETGKFSPRYLRGRLLFEEGMDHSHFMNLHNLGARVKTFELSEDYDFKAFKEEWGQKATVLFVVKPQHKLKVVALDDPPQPAPGDTLIVLVKK